MRNNTSEFNVFHPGEISSGELHALVRRQIERQETERLWVARQLHDVLGQSFTLLKLMLDGLKHAGAGEVSVTVDEALSVVDEATVKVRAVSRGMRPSMLDLSLQQSVEWLVKTYASDPGITVSFTSRGLKDNLPQELNTAVYRIIQEALMNIALHAGVKEAGLALSVRGRTLFLEISDKGRGFDTSSLGGCGGLLFMRERADMAGGKLSVKSHPGRGTVVAATFPIPHGDLAAPKPLC